MTVPQGPNQRWSLDFVSDDDKELYNIWELIEFEESESGDNMIRISEGKHRIIFINKAAIDYISIPTHKYEAGQIEAEDEVLENTK